MMAKLCQAINLMFTFTALLLLLPLSVAFTRISVIANHDPRRVVSTDRSPPHYDVSQPPSTSAISSSNFSGDLDFKHNDLGWSIVPFEDEKNNIFEITKLRLASKAMRLDCAIKGEEPPVVLCPSGGRAVLEAYVRSGKRTGFFKRKKIIARFGFTTNAGPSALPVDESIRDCFGIVPSSNLRIGAIIFMFVEPEFRSRRIGKLAVEIISAVQAYQGSDFTILVADDKGSGKLVSWYEKIGFKQAPKMQEMMGSPNAKYGVSMIAPTIGFSRSRWESLRIKW